MCLNTWLPGGVVRDYGSFGRGAIEMELSSSRPAQLLSECPLLFDQLRDRPRLLQI